MGDAKKKSKKGKSKKQHQGPAGGAKTPQQAGGAGPLVADRKEAVQKGASPARRSQK